MSILGLIGSLLGGFGGGKRSERSRRESRSAQPQSTDRISQSTGGDQVKAKAAGKLALINPVTTSTDGRCVAMIT